MSRIPEVQGSGSSIQVPCSGILHAARVVQHLGSWIGSRVLDPESMLEVSLGTVVGAHCCRHPLIFVGDLERAAKERGPQFQALAKGARDGNQCAKDLYRLGTT